MITASTHKGNLKIASCSYRNGVYTFTLETK